MVRTSLEDSALVDESGEFTEDAPIVWEGATCTPSAVHRSAVTARPPRCRCSDRRRRRRRSLGVRIKRLARQAAVTAMRRAKRLPGQVDDLGARRSAVYAMEQLGRAAANAPAPAEGDTFLAAMLPISAQMFPSASRLIARSSPRLLAALTGLSHSLQGNARPLIRTLPAILRDTARRLGSRAERGIPTSPATAATMLVRDAYRVLVDPRTSWKAMQRAHEMDRSSESFEEDAFLHNEEEDPFFRVDCLFSGCSQARDPNTNQVVCVNRSCNGRCRWGSLFGVNNICCCE
jgi:hypothetical protein